ncbi:MAG TPA: MgtC/SapB family protein [Conexibacter sp.]|nr:MgtC/SapB family protein [Conexibacter sp.]
MNWNHLIPSLFTVGSVDWPFVLARLGLAMVLGYAIGWEREQRNRAAGRRTYALISLGAALFTLVGGYAFPGGDPTRVTAQIVTGVGFVGAGVIWRSGSKTQGVTTAASIWSTSAVGTVTGAGLYGLALIAAVATLTVLYVRRFKATAEVPQLIAIAVQLTSGATSDELFEQLRAHGLQVISIEQAPNGVVLVKVEDHGMGLTGVSGLLNAIAGVATHRVQHVAEPAQN